MVLPPWRNKNGQEASRWQGEPRWSLSFCDCSHIDIALWWLANAMLQLSLTLVISARPVPVMSRGWEWRPDNLSQVPGGKQGGVWMFDSQSEAKQYPPRPLLPGWNIWSYHWSAAHIWGGVHPRLSLHDGPTERSPLERELKSWWPNFRNPSLGRQQMFPGFDWTTHVLQVYSKSGVVLGGTLESVCVHHGNEGYKHKWLILKRRRRKEVRLGLSRQIHGCLCC